MTHRRILSLWFPRLAAERLLRRWGGVLPEPFAVVGDVNGAQVVVSLNPLAEAAGVRQGQPLRDATAICAHLRTLPADPLADAAFLAVLRRWAGKFSPWVAEEGADALLLDLTGCAHLFGGEVALLAEAEADCTDLGLSVRAGLADTPGAAWALARFSGYAGTGYTGAGGAGTGSRTGGGGAGGMGARNGDAIDQEARATRSRAVKRRSWERGGAAPVRVDPVGEGVGMAVPVGAVAAPGQMRQALAPLPLAALRLPTEVIEGLGRLGLRRVADVMGLPRAALARRFGAQTLRRLDQALGLEPEPVSPARATLHFAVRLTLPDPIGLRSDIEAGIDRLLPALCARLKARGRGARRVRLEGFRVDGQVTRAEVGLARPADDPARIRPLLALKLDTMDAGFGIDCLRLEALETEPLSHEQHRGGDTLRVAQGGAREGARAGIQAGGAAAKAEEDGLADLLGKLAARLGGEAVTRLHPAQSHIPEKSAVTLAALWSVPAAEPWPAPAVPRPLLMFRSEPVNPEPEGPGPAKPELAKPELANPELANPELATARQRAQLPGQFRWRGRIWAVARALGPERIAPEWWLEDPGWRSGLRDYWRVETADGTRLWLFYAHGGAVSGGWCCQGIFA